MRAMIVKEFRELRRDHRTVAMVVVLPILLLVIFGYAANFTVEHADTAVIGAAARDVADTLPGFFQIREGITGTDPVAILRENRVDVVVDTDQLPPRVYVDGAALFVAQASVAAAAGSGSALRAEVLFNPELTTSWVLVPAIAGLVMALIGTMITSIGLVREKELGTIEQLAVMPIGAGAVIAGKIAPYFVLAGIDIAVVTVLGLWLFGVPFAGPVWVFALGAALFLCVVLGLGVLASTLSATSGQALQTALFFMLPQILLSGMIFPLESMPWGVRWIGYGLPLTYFIQVAHGVLLRGAGIADVWPALVVLACLAVVVLGAAILRFRATLAPRTPREIRPHHAAVGS